MSIESMREWNRHWGQTCQIGKEFTDHLQRFQDSKIWVNYQVTNRLQRFREGKKTIDRIMTFGSLPVGKRFKFIDNNNVVYTKISKDMCRFGMYDIFTDQLSSVESIEEVLFAELEAGAKFRFVGDRTVHIKISEKIVEFSDLEMGDKFQLNGRGIVYTKIAKNDCKDQDTTYHCPDGFPYTPVITKFDDLEIGARFKYPEGSTHYLKTEKDRCYAVAYNSSGYTVKDLYCPPLETVVPLKPRNNTMLFKDLKMGAKFKYLDSEEEYVKIGDKSCIWASKPNLIIDACNRPVKLIEPETGEQTMKFSELENGAKFRFLKSEVCTKLSENWFRDSCGQNHRISDMRLDVILKVEMFSDLEIGDKFRYCYNGKEGIKIGVDSYVIGNSGANFVVETDCGKEVKLLEAGAWHFSESDCFETQFDVLEIGTIFRFNNEGWYSVKITKHKRQYLETGEAYVCHVRVKCIPGPKVPDYEEVFSLTKTFNDLEIGDRFRNKEGGGECIKIADKGYVEGWGKDSNYLVEPDCDCDRKVELLEAGAWRFPWQKVLGINFSALEIGAKFKIIAIGTVCTKISGDTYRDIGGRILDCFHGTKCTLEVVKFEIPGTTFGDLEIGAEFQWYGAKDNYIKISKKDCQNTNGVGRPFSCFDYEKCTKILDATKFSDLAIGTKFKLLNDNAVCTKMTEDNCRDAEGGCWGCNRDAKCIPELVKFSDLEVGTWYYDSGIYYMKTGAMNTKRNGDHKLKVVNPNKSVRVIELHDLPLRLHISWVAKNLEKDKTFGELYGGDRKLTFKDLLVGVRFHFNSGDSSSYLKTAPNFYRDLRGRNLGCGDEVKCVPIEIVFSDLEVGSEFVFTGQIPTKVIYTKISKSSCKIPGGNGTFSCLADSECVRVIDIEAKNEKYRKLYGGSMEFGDLPVGMAFRFPHGATRLVKLSDHVYRYPNGYEISCGIHGAKCIPLGMDSKLMTFEDLPIGARYKYADDAKVCIKLAKDKYAFDGKLGSIRFPGLPVEALEIKELRFEDLPIGIVFRINCAANSPEDYYLKTKNGCRRNGVGKDRDYSNYTEVELTDGLVFKDLTLGVWFKFIGSKSRCLRTGHRTYRVDGTGRYIEPNPDAIVLPVEPLRFKDLKVGAWFKCINSETRYLKTAHNRHRENGGYDVVINPDVVVLLVEPLTFKDLKVGAKYTYVYDTGECIKLAVDKYTCKGKLYVAKLSELQVNLLENKRLRLRDLPMGVVFRFIGCGDHYLKTENGCLKNGECILDPRFQVEIKFRDAKHNGYMEVELVDDLTFKELKVGAWFTYVGKKDYHLKTLEGCRLGAFGCDYSPAADVEVVPVNKFTFGNLRIGSIFKSFLCHDRDDSVYCLKTSEHMARVSGISSDFSFSSDEVVEMALEIKKFSSILLGSWFRYPGEQEHYQKLSVDEARQRGSNTRHTQISDRLVETLTFEEVER